MREIMVKKLDVTSVAAFHKLNVEALENVLNACGAKGFVIQDWKSNDETRESVTLWEKGNVPVEYKVVPVPAYAAHSRFNKDSSWDWDIVGETINTLVVEGWDLHPRVCSLKAECELFFFVLYR